MKNLTAASLVSVTLAGTSATGLVCLALVDSSIKSSLLLILASTACFILVRASAAMRHMIWSTTMLGLLMMPACALLLPQWHVLPSWLSLEHRFEPTLPITRHVVTPWPAIVDALQTDVPTFAEVVHVSLEDLPSKEQITDPLFAVAEPIRIRIQASFVLGIWAAGCIVALLPIVIGFFRLRRLEHKFRSGSPIDSKLILKIKTIAGDLGICEPRLIIGPKGAMPMVWSFGRSRILLPSGVDQWSETKVQSVLLHEMIHLRRHDPAVCAIGLLACAVNWFNPFAWYAIHRLRIECEQACDDQVLQMGVDAIDYATHLLQLSTSECLSSRAGSLALAMASKPLVENRIASILDEKLNRRGVTLFRALALLAVVSIGVVFLATMATRSVNNNMQIVETSETVEQDLDGIRVEINQLSEPNSFGKRTFEHLDLSLEECIAIALVNTQAVHALPGSQRQTSDVASSVLSSPSGSLATSGETATTATTTSSQAAVTDQNGNRILPLGASRANQVDGVEESLSEFDTLYTSFVLFNKADRSRNVRASNAFKPQSLVGRDTPGQMAISKRMATGGVATIRSQTIASFNNIPTQHEYHPLTQIHNSLANRIPIVLTRIIGDISVGEYEERVRNLVRDVEFAYWDLFAAYFKVNSTRTAVDDAALAWKFASAKLNTSAKNAEAQARVTFHQFQAQLDAAIAGGGSVGNEPGLFGREQNLRKLIGWPANDGRLIRPSDKPAVALAEFDRDAARDETLCRNIEIRNHKLIVKQRELELMLANNQALPVAGASLNNGWNGLGSSPIDRHGENQPSTRVFDEIFSGSLHEGGVRMEYNPNAFGSRFRLNNVQNKQLALAREHRVLEAKETAAVHRLSALWQQLDRLHKQMTQQFQALNAAQTLVEITQAKLEASDSGNADANIDNLLRSQQIRVTAGQSYILFLAEYNKSLVEIHALKGSLLEYNNLALK